MIYKLAFSGGPWDGVRVAESPYVEFVQVIGADRVVTMYEVDSEFCDGDSTELRLTPYVFFGPQLGNG